jgi:hypothetical protein
MRRLRRRRRRRRQRPVVAWRALKPVLEELVREETVRQTGESVGTEAEGSGLSAFHLPVQIVVVTPDYSQAVCPDCGGPTKCKRSYYIHPQDIYLGQLTILQVYREVRECCDPSCEGCIVPGLDFVERVA